MKQSKEIARLANRIHAKGREALNTGSMAANAAAGATEPTKPQFHPMQTLKRLETGKLLGGKELNQAARALTALEIRPQLHGYKQLANQLTAERNEETTGLGKLGTELQGQVGGVYKGIGAAGASGVAAQQAIAGMLNQQSAEIAKQGSENLAQMQGGAVGDLNKGLALRGAPTGGSAQEALSAAVGQQQQAQTTNAQAAQQFAASQGAGNAALAQQLAASTQAAEGAAVGGIGRDIVGRVGESNQKYGESIQQALGKLADVKATKGATFNKNLLALRGEEQKFLLGKQAVAGEKAKLGLEGKEVEAEVAQNAIKNALEQQKANASSTSAEASLISALSSKYKAHHPAASSGELAKKQRETEEDIAEVRSLLPGLISAYGIPGTGPEKNPQKELNQFILAVNGKASANPTLVQQVVKHWWQKRGKRAAKDPNGASLGR